MKRFTWNIQYKKVVSPIGTPENEKRYVLADCKNQFVTEIQGDCDEDDCQIFTSNKKEIARIDHAGRVTVDASYIERFDPCKSTIESRCLDKFLSESSLRKSNDTPTHSIGLYNCCVSFYSHHKIANLN